MNIFLKKGDIVYSDRELDNYVLAGAIGIVVEDKSNCPFVDWEPDFSRNLNTEGCNRWAQYSYNLVKIGEL